MVAQNFLFKKKNTAHRALHNNESTLYPSKVTHLPLDLGSMVFALALCGCQNTFMGARTYTTNLTRGEEFLFSESEVKFQSVFE